LRSCTTSTPLRCRAPGRPPPVLAATSRPSLTTSGCWFPQPPAGQPPVISLADFAGERWIQSWGEVGDVTDMLAALSGFRPRVACRSSDYRFMSALVGAGVGVALVPSLALPGNPQVRDLQTDHSSAHPLHRRLAPQTAPAEPSRRTTDHRTPHPRARETGDPSRARPSNPTIEDR
jgi:DNA-binding transcriptional LysR family regulator